MTDAEQILWFRLRLKRVLGVQFYRQKPLLEFIVDFYAPAAGLVIEVDGAHHLTQADIAADARRTLALESLGFRVLRFDNRQVLTQTRAVMEAIYAATLEHLSESG